MTTLFCCCFYHDRRNGVFIIDDSKAVKTFVRTVERLPKSEPLMSSQEPLGSAKQSRKNVDSGNNCKLSDYAEC